MKQESEYDKHESSLENFIENLKNKKSGFKKIIEELNKNENNNSKQK